MSEQPTQAPYQAPANGWRTFLTVWITQSNSVFGSALTFFSVTVWLTTVLYPLPEQKPALGIALSAVSLAFAVPVVFGAPIAGAWADRHDRKRTMIAMDTLNALLSLTLAALVFTNSLNLPVLVTLITLFSLAGAFHGSAFDTSYAMLVPEQMLPRANGMMQTIGALSGVLAPVVAAAALSLPALARQGHLPGSFGASLARLANGMPIIVIFDALTFFGAAATLLFLTIPSPKRTDLRDAAGRVKKSMWSDVKEGALYIWRRRPLLWLLGTFTVANFISGPMNVLLPLLVKFNLAADWARRGFTLETALALITMVASLGGVAGGLFISSWGGLKARRVYGVVVPLVVEGILQAFLGFSPLLFFSAGILALSNFLVPVMNAHSQTIWQIQTPRELQGRVFSVRRLIAQISWPLSTAIAGVVAGLFNPGTVIAILGIFLAAFCTLQLFNPYLMRVEDKESLDRMAAAAAAASAVPDAGK
ncbi:MAG: MFS transporter [Bacillota bacterium]